MWKPIVATHTYTNLKSKKILENSLFQFKRKTFSLLHMIRVNLANEPSDCLYERPLYRQMQENCVEQNYSPCQVDCAYLTCC